MARAAINAWCRSRPRFFDDVAALSRRRTTSRRCDGSGVRGVERTASRTAVDAERARGDHDRRPTPRRAPHGDLSRAAPHLFHPAARSRHGVGSVPGSGRSPVDLVDPDLPASRQRLAGRRVPTCSRGHRRPGRDRVAKCVASSTMPAIEPRPADERWARIAARAPRPGRDHAATTWIRSPCQHDRHRHVGRHRAAAVRRLADRPRPRRGCAAPRRPTPHRGTTSSGSPTSPDERRGEPSKQTTIHLRLGMLRVFFERIIEWGYPDAPTRSPIFADRPPQLDDPLPKFLDDAHSRQVHGRRRRDADPVGGSWSRCSPAPGSASASSAGLDADAMVRIGETHWLRVPVGKLHNDRYVPLHPLLVELHRPHGATEPARRHRRCSSPTRPTVRPAQRRTRSSTASPDRRHRPRPPPPTPPHPRHPSDQPRHEPRSDRRAARPPLAAHDPRLRPHRRPHRRRPILRRRRQSRPALHHPLDNITGIRAVTECADRVDRRITACRESSVIHRHFDDAPAPVGTSAIGVGYRARRGLDFAGSVRAEPSLGIGDTGFPEQAVGNE